MGRPETAGSPPPPLAVTMGEPAGIGGEIVLRAWSESRAEGAAVPCFFCLDDPRRLRDLSQHLGWAVDIVEISEPAAARAAFGRGLPVLPLAAQVAAPPGRPNPENGAAVLDSIRRAVALTQSGEAAAVVTNPIHKATLYAAGFRHPGHTEFLADLAGLASEPVMMLAGPSLRVVPVTIHLALRDAIAKLTPESIIHAGRSLAQALKRDFGIPVPRIAVAGLNPHAGEEGSLGTEDRDIIAPAVARLRDEGIDARGPQAADGLFHATARRGYDAALCMYHDQALIPVKALDFDQAVNVTLGLPFVRTSPDHGTAFDIAGRGEADPASLLAALRLGARMAETRRASRETTAA